MDDIRKINYGNKLKRRANTSKFLNFLKRNWIKIFILFFVLCIIFFPETVGSIIGEWFNKLVTSFIKNLTF
jgi:hypothetical protein